MSTGKERAKNALRVLQRLIGDGSSSGYDDDRLWVNISISDARAQEVEDAMNSILRLDLVLIARSQTRVVALMADYEEVGKVLKASPGNVLGQAKEVMG